ncbi:unnamed protein product, partial [Rotaria sp. Silwood1]
MPLSDCLAQNMHREIEAKSIDEQDLALMDKPSSAKQCS